MDEFSDPDIELISPTVLSLYGNDDWLCFLGQKLVAAPNLENGGVTEPRWPASLVVLDGAARSTSPLPP